ncbi:hypothetical protein [Pelagimonas varians]|uniref:Uncharacterized protein n=1 Tax=Pelagimonas varians TaxID=696760 RepID=A0A238KN80_9RHOB|nr:hypothetical protein [Pelagimonas varians]PYG28918.1 hypothetical protein C8N36_110141 [Pelagimonas varians]SMX44121.1 hypothetical protein PEV8663_02792 [Pelagimonas varians]
MKFGTKIALALTLCGSQIHASEYDAAMQSFLDGNIRNWATAPEIVSAIQSQNTTTSGFDEAHIIDLDTIWRSEVGSDSTPTITPVLNNAAAEFLRGQVAQMDGMITEVFIMDSVGLNVAASGVTSDYWQGDEAKFTQTYAVGSDAVHFSDIDFDESSQSYQAQISFTIIDPASGAPIGAMTVGVLADGLM